MRARPLVTAAVLARRIAVAAAALALAAACTVSWSGPDSPSPPADPGTGLGRPDAPTAAASDVAQRSLKDIERFWTATFPSLSGGAGFKPVQGGYHPYTRRDPPPPCGDQPGEYQPNAFYCSAGDFIAWDAQTLVPQLASDFGDLLVGVVLAHEYGHAVQARLRQDDQPTVVLEQQADCYAGAWVADVRAGRSTAFRDIGPQQLDNTVAGLLQLRDQPGTPAQAPQAHGNAFDRIRAFQEGVEQGARRCAGYRADNLPLTEVPFTAEEAATGGDLPYGEAVADLSSDVQAYWTRTYPRLADAPWQPLRVLPYDTTQPSCPDPQKAAEGAFYCPSGDFVAFDNARLGPALYQHIGDNAVGMLFGDLFARAVQQRRGRPVADRAGQLAVDCLAGTWTYDLLHRSGTTTIRLSAGDLDEAVQALLVFGRADKSSGASAFDRIAAFRGAVLGGLPACT
jgi:predicted metalloprotease